MADGKKDTPAVVVEEGDGAPPQNAAPKGKPATTVGNLNEWGEPLTITVPAPFADIARGFLQRLNSSQRGNRHSRGPPRGRGRGRHSCKKEGKKLAKEKKKLEKKQLKKGDKNDEEVDKEIEKLRKEIELGEAVHADNAADEQDEGNGNETGFDALPEFIRNRAQRARDNNETIPEWVLGLLSALDMAPATAARNETEDEKEEFGDENEEMPPWLQMGKHHKKQWKKHHKDLHRSLKKWNKHHGHCGGGDDGEWHAAGGRKGPSHGPGPNGRRSPSPGPKGRSPSPGPRGRKGPPPHFHRGPPGRRGPGGPWHGKPGGGPGFRFSNGKNKINIGPFELEVDMKYTETEKKAKEEEIEKEVPEVEKVDEEQEAVEEEVDNEKINEIMGGLTQKELEQIFALMKKDKGDNQ